MVSPERNARVLFFSGVTTLLEGKFILQGVHCYGQDGGKLLDAEGTVIVNFDGEGSIEWWRKFEVDGLVKTTGATSDMYVYLDASVPGGGVI
jgi:hypothetical protein